MNTLDGARFPALYDGTGITVQPVDADEHTVELFAHDEIGERITVIFRPADVRRLAAYLAARADLIDPAGATS